MRELKQFRRQVDDFMRHHPQSPLSEEQRQQFTGLNYFPEDPSMRFTVQVTRLPENEPLVQMETSTGEMRLYRRWGTFGFEVDGQRATLTIYSDPHGHDFFLPFRDATNGRETYSAGRYLDGYRPGLKQVADTLFEIDFNFAYNPYCAYSPDYTCPLPPRENWLDLPIPAGEKVFT